MEILLTTETNVSRSPQLSNERLLNFFVEGQPPEAQGQAPLFGAPGISTVGTLGIGPHRGAWNFNGIPYIVSGDELWSFDRDGVGTLRGTGITGTNRVGMSDNGFQLCIVNGAAGYIYTPSGGLQAISSTAFYPADTVTFMDGYFLFDRANTNEWFISSLYNGLTYNGTDFAVAEGQPGFVTGLAQNLQFLYIFCSNHIELWYDAGSANFPFQRYSGGIIPFGTISPYTIAKQDGALWFLGFDHVFYRLQANVPLRISTHAIEHIIEKAPQTTDAYVITWTWEGHKFLALTLPSADVTLVYDIATGKWHERDSVDSLFNPLGPWRAATSISAYSEIYFGDRLSGAIGRQNWNVYTEFDNPMRGLIQSMNIQSDRKRVYCSRFELTVQAGVGTQTGQGEDPQIMLQRSVDGGMTWTQPQLWRSMGRIGAYLQRLRWMAQGQGRQICWRLTVTDPVPRTIIKADADISTGMG